MRDKLNIIGEYVCTNCLYDGEKREFKLTVQSLTDSKEIIFTQVESLAFDQEEVLDHEKPGVIEIFQNNIHLILNHKNEVGKRKVVRLKIKAKDVEVVYL